ncbi:MAG: hypothetical protein FH761_13570 [Firmicutes bacterium]|nr:hypothetical protein [Bacillota bacterium]
MKKNGNYFKRLATKTVAVLIGGALVGFILMSDIGTYSWFIGESDKEISALAASTDDIIENLEVIENSNGEKAIRFEKSQDFTSDPIMYFSVHGEASEYILHINPVKLDRFGEYTISLEPNINFIQFAKLLVRKDNLVRGKIRVKYLNEFIDEEQDIELSKEYLISRYWENIKREDGKFIKNEDSDEVKGQLTNLITYIANHVDWSSDKKQKTDYESDTIQSPVKRILLSKYQTQIVNTIVHRLIPHLEDLYNMIDSLTNSLNEQIADNDKLKAENETLGKNIKILELEKDELNIQKDDLKATKSNLESKIKNLEQTIIQLSNQLQDEKTSIEEEQSLDDDKVEENNEETISSDDDVDGSLEQDELSSSENQNIEKTENEDTGDKELLEKEEQSSNNDDDKVEESDEDTITSDDSTEESSEEDELSSLENQGTEEIGSEDTGNEELIEEEEQPSNSDNDIRKDSDEILSSSDESDGENIDENADNTVGDEI